LDAFSFFNELDLLEVRLHELDAVVDHFIIVESRVTHSRVPKPLYFEENRPRFERFLPKITTVALDADYMLSRSGDSHWDRETLQRDSLMSALEALDLGADDLVIISDLDEIPRAEAVRRLSHCEEASSFPVLLMMDWFIYNARWRSKVPWGLIAKEGAVVVTGQVLQSGATLTQCRRFLREGYWRAGRELPWGVIEGGGWHFSSFGGAQTLRTKLESYADDVFYQAFLLDPTRLARLQHFGVPYFFLPSMRSIEDNNFLPTNPELALEGLTRRAWEGSGPRALFFPPSDPAPSNPEVTDPGWLRQDFLAARLFMAGEVLMTLPWAAAREGQVTFEYECGRHAEQVAGFCEWKGAACMDDLGAHVARACDGQPPGAAGHFKITLEDATLVPVRIADQLYIVEHRPGTGLEDLADGACKDAARLGLREPGCVDKLRRALTAFLVDGDVGAEGIHQWVPRLAAVAGAGVAGGNASSCAASSVLEDAVQPNPPAEWPPGASSASVLTQ
jgi:beta-1,4-mannosyl-glycoprotein beta-1,4-N-acetylglucosaminyltransferase